MQRCFFRCQARTRTEKIAGTGVIGMDVYRYMGGWLKRGTIGCSGISINAYWCCGHWYWYRSSTSTSKITGTGIDTVTGENRHNWMFYLVVGAHQLRCDFQSFLARSYIPEIAWKQHEIFSSVLNGLVKINIKYKVSEMYYGSYGLWKCTNTVPIQFTLITWERTHIKRFPCFLTTYTEKCISKEDM